MIPAGIEVMKIAAAQGRFQCEFTDFPWGSDFYLRTGRMLDPDGIEQMLKFDADLPRRDRRPARGGPHHGTGDDPSLPPATAAVRQLEADAAAAGHRFAAEGTDGGGHRHGVRPGELGGRVPAGSGVASTVEHRTNLPNRPGSSRGEGSNASRVTPLRWRRRAHAGCWPAPRNPMRSSTRWCCGTKSSRMWPKSFRT